MKYALGDDRVETEGDDYWIAPSAHVVGKVKLGAASSVWFGAVIRGDNDQITLGARSNVQENAVLHTDAGIKLTIGEGVTIGHLAMLHGCTIGNNSLIGIGAVVLNNAKIGSNCIVGAKALITEGMEIPDNSLVVGAPGKIIKDVSPEVAKRLTKSAEGYVERSRLFKAQMQEMGA